MATAEVKLAHMSELERRAAAILMKVDLAAIAGPPVGAIVGEAPGPNTRAALPMFPLPERSAGGRLLEYSGMDAADYLGRVARRNLFDELKSWSVPEARRQVFEVWWWLNGKPRVRRVVLLGNRVAAAFGVERMWSATTFSRRNLTVVAIPHPSGKCRVYNDEAARKRAGAVVRWAAGIRRTLP